jgi:uncharacterized protein YlxP (DUF503 family)
MHAAALRVDLHLPSVHSLKEKRGVIRPIVDGSRNRFGVAAAEVDAQDRWQRAGLGFAAVGSNAGHVRSVLDSVERFVWSFPEVEVLAVEFQWMGEDG